MSRERASSLAASASLRSVMSVHEPTISIGSPVASRTMVLLVVHPEIGAVGTADAILDRPLVVLLKSAVDPGIDAGDVVGVNAIAPKIGIVEIFRGRAAEQPGDAVAHEGGLEIAAGHSAIEHRR